MPKTRTVRSGRPAREPIVIVPVPRQHDGNSREVLAPITSTGARERAALLAQTMSVAEMAKELKLVMRTAYHYCRTGVIPAVKVGSTIRVRKDLVAGIKERGLVVRTK